MLPGVLLTGLVLLAADPGPALGTASAPSAEDLKAYESERSKAGQDADAHVRLALWCEAHGMTAERARHLALAVLHDPAHPMARGLSGLVAYRGRWQPPDAVADKVKADADHAAAVAQYLDRRAKAGDTADGQWRLAVWCEQNGLNEQATAHLQAVVRLDPSRESAWKRLGYRKQNGRWVTDAQLAAEKEEAALQRHADRQWKTALEGDRKALESRDPARRDEADAALTGVTDPRAVPAVWAVFAAGRDDARQAVAVRLLGQIDVAASSRALAVLAVSGRSAEVRRTAAETLKRRDVREFADLLIAQIREPIKYEVKPVGGQGAPGQLSVHGKQADVKRLYTPPPVATPAVLPTDRITFDQFGRPVLLRPFADSFTVASSGLIVYPGVPTGSAPGAAQAIPQFIASHGGGAAGKAAAERALRNTAASPAVTSPAGILNVPPGRYEVAQRGVMQIPIGQIVVEAENANAAAQRRLQKDIDAIEAYNRSLSESNDRVLGALAGVAGQNLGPDREAWGRWWIDQIGMTFMPLKTQQAPTVIEQVPVDYTPQPAAPAVLSVQTFTRRAMSCFGAGTPVKTIDGPRPIESLAVGDLVLSQDVKTGALGYRPVVKVHHNPPTSTFRVTLAGGEVIVSSPFHRFWKAGQGWVMARDLKPGDTLRALGGLTRVSALEDDRVQPVFNLDVDDTGDFFVGRAGALVHDNTLPDLRLAPFDVPAPAPAVARTGGPPARP